MTVSNRVRLAVVKEVTPGTTPAITTTTRMRSARYTGETLSFSPTFVDSDEIRADRMLNDPIRVQQAPAGGINYELSYPVDRSPMSEFLSSAFFSPWVNTPTFDNDGVADSVLTDAGTVANTYAVVSGGAAVVVGMLARVTGFAESANNQIFRVASSTATTIVGTAIGLTAQTAPPAAAKLKVVGFQGASADITATATGLASTVLDFTTLGLVPGNWYKIGGTASVDKFGITPANNDWVRLTAVTAHALTFDNRPVGWGVDAGTGKTVKVWQSDYLRNGVTANSVSIEKGFLDQAIPTYIVNTGMQVDKCTVAVNSKQKITGSLAFMGMGGSQSTATLSATPDAATTTQVMAANANVGRLDENGIQLVAQNWGKSLTISYANNLRAVEALDSLTPVAIQPGQFQANGTIETYFGDNSLLTKFYNGTVTALNARIAKNSQAIIFQFPRVTLTGGGNPAASAKNIDIVTNFNWETSIDTTLTQIAAQIERFEYFEV